MVKDAIDRPSGVCQLNVCLQNGFVLDGATDQSAAGWRAADQSAAGTAGGAEAAAGHTSFMTRDSQQLFAHFYRVFRAGGTDSSPRARFSPLPRFFCRGSRGLPRSPWGVGVGKMDYWCAGNGRHARQAGKDDRHAEAPHGSLLPLRLAPHTQKNVEMICRIALPRVLAPLPYTRPHTPIIPTSPPQTKAHRGITTPWPASNKENKQMLINTALKTPK